MEKRKPHYALSRIKELIRSGCYRVTRSSIESAVRDFRYSEPSQLAECVMDFQAEDFYKSMTTLHDSKLWQDVYHPEIEGKPAYVKLQIVEGVSVVISFKKLEDT